MQTILLSKPVRDLRDKYLRELPGFPWETRKAFYLNYEDVIDAHFSIAEFFQRQDYGLGGVGYRDQNLFLSTIDRQYSGIIGVDLGDEYCIIATLMYGIARNHPFYDANKRTALLCALIQLHRLGRSVTANEKELEDFIVSVADGTINRRAGVKELRKKGDHRAEISFIGRYLQKNSRKNSRLNSMLKFRELRSIVEKNGFKFSNSFKGTIDIIKSEEKRTPRFFLGDRIEKKDIVLGNIAYHGEGWEVPDSTVKYVRQLCGLTDQDGFDGDVLIRDAQPTFKLIASYRSALQNLAYR